MATDLPTQILHKLNASSGTLSSSDFPDVPTLSLKAALDSLKSRDMVTYTTVDTEVPTLTPEAEVIVEKGSHEARVFEAVLSKGLEGLKIGDLEGAVGKESAKVGQGKAFKEGWIKKDGAKLVTLVESITDTTQVVLSKIAKEEAVEPKTVTDLKKRKLVKMEKRITFKDIAKGEKFATEIVKEETDLTAELLASGEWKNKTFKPYNFNALGVPATSGALHPCRFSRLGASGRRNY
jgi:phenylalanyl-tRNA synthetase alpha chain